MTTDHDTETTPETTRELIARRYAEEVDRYVAAVEESRLELDVFEASVTQREWLLMCRRLECDRSAIRTDGSLRLLALGWLREKREHGGASWDALLDMTDRQLLDVHGWPHQPEVPAELEALDDDGDAGE